MADRVDSTSSSSIPPTSQRTGVDEAEQASRSEAASSSATDAPMSTDEAGQCVDVWEKSQSSDYDDVVHRDQPGADGDVAPSVSDEEAMSVWEMAGLTATHGESSADAPVGHSVDIAENGATPEIEQLFAQLHTDANPTSATVRREFDIALSSPNRNMPREELIELAAHPDELRDHLLQIADDPGLADQMVDEIQARVVSHAGEQIAARARPQIQAGMESLQALNDSSDSRRAFLGAVAQSADSRDEIAGNLVEFGVRSSTADNIAEVLDELRGDDEAMAAFLAGDSGERDLLGGQLRSPYDQAERRFERELESMHDGLESLQRSLDTNQIRHDQFLTDPTVAHIRDEVLADMGAVLDAGETQNGLGEMFQEAIDASVASQRQERVAIGAVALAGGIGVTVATAGAAPAVAAGAGVASAGVQAAPDVAVARQDVDRAQAAVNADISHPELVDMARRDRNVAYALSAAGIVASGAIANPGHATMADAGLEGAATGYDM